MEITIASWNIAGARPVSGDGHLAYDAEDVEYFVSQLRTLQPDVVCLQETHINDTRSVASVITATLGGYAMHEIAMSPSHIDGAYLLGNAILSKMEPEQVNDVTYPYPKFPLARTDGAPTVRHEKGFQLAQFAFGNVVNTQMQPLKFLGTPYDSPNGKVFAHEMEEVLLEHVAMPVILCGDLNYNNPKELYPALLTGMQSALPDAPTRPDGKKTDFIYYSSEFTLLDSGIVQTRTDHYLCYARLQSV